MGPTEHPSNAGTDDAGARFYRCALQVNPHHYQSTFRGQPSDGDAVAHALAVVDRAVDLGIEVLGVTDHNSVDSIPAFLAAAADRPVWIFPGFELSSSEGVHVLCFYPVETQLERLERYLGEFGIRDTHPSSASSDKHLGDLLETVERQGGIAVAAHVTGSGGLLSKLSGDARARAWKDPRLLAVQIPGSVQQLPQAYRDIIRDRNPHYRRIQPPEPGLAIATVNAKDVVQADDLDDPGATLWIKMHAVGVDGLRQAFLDPGSRIRLNSDDLVLDPHIELRSIGWEGGFLDGTEVALSPNLNVLIGGRGTGKSTVIESIRSVLDLPLIGDDARRAHEGIVRQVLRSGTRITLRVRVHRPAPHDYVMERIIPNPPLVREVSGEVLPLAPRDILPQVEAFGQHEISELARDPEKLTRLLDRFIENDEALARRKAPLLRALAENRRGLSEATAEIASAEERLAGLPGLQETLARFREAGIEERLRERSLLLREEGVLESVPERLAPLRDALDLMNKELPLDVTFLSDGALAELPGKEVFFRLRDGLAELSGNLERVAGELARVFDRADARIDEVRAAWQVRRQRVVRDYEGILRELQKSRVDGEEFVRLRQRVEELRPVEDRVGLLRRLEEEHAKRRRSLLAEWEELKAKEHRMLDNAARKVSRLLRGRVQVEVIGGSNREPLFKVLREGVGGRMSEAIERLRAEREFSLTEFVAACRGGAELLGAKYGFTPMQARRLAEADPEVLMRIEELDLAPTTKIRLNTAPNGEPPSWQALEDLSTGQRATAVLLLLLLESTEPLIVDQPEDDLDNRFITEGVVPRMREEKQRRQFVFSTHNANIPVLGDAELIVGLSAAGEAADGRARVAPGHAGSIDSPTVRELVEEILEGGQAAFETRRRKYGF